MQAKDYKMNFRQMEQGDLYKIIAFFIHDPQKFFKQTSAILIQKYKTYPNKQGFDTTSKNHVQYYVTRFLISAMMTFARNTLMMMHAQRDYELALDQLGFVIGMFRTEDAVAVRKMQSKSICKLIPNVTDVMSRQVRQLFLQCFGKQYFDQDQKRKVELRIDHGGTTPVQCTMGLDISTAVIGVRIFQNIHNKPIFTDAVLLNNMCRKRKVEPDLVNKIILFSKYIDQLMVQKNIKVTKLYIEQQRKMFGSMTTAMTLNRLAKYNGMVSAYMITKLGRDLKSFRFLNVRSRRKIVFDSRLSKQQAYERFKKMYKDITTEQYVQTTPKQTNMDRSDRFVIAAAGIKKYSNCGICQGRPPKKIKKKTAV